MLWRSLVVAVAGSSYGTCNSANLVEARSLLSSCMALSSILGIAALTYQPLQPVPSTRATCPVVLLKPPRASCPPLMAQKDATFEHVNADLDNAERV